MQYKMLIPFILSTISMTSFAAGTDDVVNSSLLAKCEGCHGKYGLSNDDNRPNLAGQKPSYFIRQLQAFKAGTRINANMQNQASALSDQDMQNLAAYFSSKSTLPSFSANVLKIPFVKILSDLYEGELEFDDSTKTLKIKSVKPHN